MINSTYWKSMLLPAIGFALASYSAAALAQGSVTLYGTLDAGLLFTNKTIDPATGQSSGKQLSLINSGENPSVFGLKGKEDLGGGLSAQFQLESGISIANGGFDNSNGNFFGRQAWGGLSGSFGEVRLGLQYSPFEYAIYYLDPRSFAQLGSSVISWGDNSLTGAFVSNAITYTSPKMDGLTARLLYALGGVPGNFSAGRQYSAMLEYEYGGLMIVAGID